jgi:hypothetical protein
MAKLACRKGKKDHLDEFGWRSYTENVPFPWPISPLPLWVETKSIFHGGTTKIREFTRAELGQLFDLLPEWAENISQEFCTWNDGSPPPIRLLAEVGITGALWIKQVDSVKREPQLDLRRSRPPWTSVAGRVANIENQIERLAYFGWVWEPRQAGEVSTATKDDIAGIDFSLWDIGGESRKMETARQTIRKLLFRCWIRRLYLEAIKCLHTHGEGEYEVNRAAINEALTHACHSSWWEWLDGSRLFFWRWSSIWHEEARDGAKAFHKYVPPPCLKSRSPPIKEQ